jgi:hypothetical protein
MTANPRQLLSLSPSAVAIHDHGDMPRTFFEGNVKLRLDFGGHDSINQKEQFMKNNDLIECSLSKLRTVEATQN